MDPNAFQLVLKEVLTQQNVALATAIKDALQSPRQTTPTKDTIINGPHARIPRFEYDPSHGVIFENWLSRYEEVINKEGAELSQEDKARFILQKLDQISYDRFSTHILPKKPTELTYQQTIESLKRLFGHNLSLTTIRYNFFTCECDDDNNRMFDDYTCKVNRLRQLADISPMSDEQLKCFVWVCGLKKPQYEDIRQVGLKFLETNANATLTDLHADVKQFVQLQNTSSTITQTSSTQHTPIHNINNK